MRILFVDDEPGIRRTLPQILRHHGFEVEVAGTVAEALRHISDGAFDVLISDLNIGEPGDGFTVVSAMRRTQPQCRNMILTGYPGFETALQAIRNQVDDFLIKPASVRSLLRAVEQRIEAAPPPAPLRAKPLSRILRDAERGIVARVLQGMKAHSEIGALSLDDDNRVAHLSKLIKQVAEELESGSLTTISSGAARSAAEYGRRRHEQGYSVSNLIDDSRVLEKVIYDVIQENLLVVDLSNLLPELKRVNEVLDMRLKEVLRAYLEAEHKAA